MRKSNFTNLRQFTAKDIIKFTQYFNCCNKTDKGCILWTDDLFKYGIFCPGNKKRTILAHRFSYLLFNGPLKETELVRHQCDIPNCVNPDHLEKGTDQDNANDRKYRNFIQYAPGYLTKQTLSKIISYKERKMSDEEIVINLTGEYKPPKTWINFLLDAVNAEIHKATN